MNVLDYGDMREDIVLEPVSGKALTVQRGEVLRIMQEVGGQCVDFNCFNLHDYREYMSVGHMRRQGFRLQQGDYVLSAPPRSNLMMYIAEKSDSCVTDLLGSRCSADLFEAAWGFDLHTNCQDTLAEAIGEYGLNPDDTHDSFNMWMNTGWNDIGRWEIRRNPGNKGDFIDLLSLMDVLAVPIVCGSGDIAGVSNFSLKPIRVQVFESSDGTLQVAQRHLDRFGVLRNQRSPKDFRISSIKTDRELRRDPKYIPQFPNFPLRFEEIEVELGPEEQRDIGRMLERGIANDSEEALRVGVFTWYLAHRTEPNPFITGSIAGD